MPDKEPDLSDRERLRQKALSRWVNEGGASAEEHQDDSTTGMEQSDDGADVTNSELVLLRVRLIAVENLLIALLADASERQLELARGAAAYIAPRPGSDVHPLTVRAATQLSDLIERAIAFRG